jgi:hypothetical protein
VPGRQEPGHAGASIGSPPRVELDLTSRQPSEIVQPWNGLVDRAVVAEPLVEVNRGRIDGQVVKHRT